MTPANSPENINYVQSRVGMWLSAACAVHCAVTPLLFLIAPALSNQIEGMVWIEWLALGLAFTMTLTQLVPEYQYHKKPKAVQYAALGLGGLLLGLVGQILGMSELLHTLCMVLGGVAMALAFYIGHRLRHHPKVA